MPGPDDQTATALIALRYAEGDRVPDIARDHGVSPETIRRRLRRMGVALRPRGRPKGAKSAAWHAEAERLRKAGWAHKAIGEAVGRSEHVVRTTLSRLRRGDG